MSLIKCPECQKDISDSAKICPNCGYSLKSKYIKSIKMATLFSFNTDKMTL